MLKPLNSKNLQKHIFATYINIRYGAAVIAFVFPLLLWFGGEFIYDVPRQCSMSAYYHADQTTPHCDEQKALTDDYKVELGQYPNTDEPYPLGQSHNGEMRSYFVGLLFMLGGIFYLYKGYSDEENIALNLAGVFAFGVALFPMDWTGKASGLSLHGVFAVLLFLSIAYVCLFRASDTLKEMTNLQQKQRFIYGYQITGWSMIVSPLVAWLFTVVIKSMGAFVFFAEMFGIWAFASYWLLKSRELSITHAEQKALYGNLDMKNKK